MVMVNHGLDQILSFASTLCRRPRTHVSIVDKGELQLMPWHWKRVMVLTMLELRG